MNLIVQSLASEQWGYVVKALLHTLWLGGLAAGGLYSILRRQTNPAVRYRWCVGALVAVVMGGIVAWAMLQGRPAAAHSPGTATPVTAPARILVDGETASTPMVSAAATPGPSDVARSARWTPWLALLWLGGVAAMLARAGSLVGAAEKLRRKSRVLDNEAVLKLIDEARHKLGLARRVRVVVTEQLTSPAVMGLVTPVLILPLAMVTTLPMAQLQLILLHELAHIRRGDYLVNLCQMLAESLLFFNPAVWWISRQIRQEREACCDAVAIALAGEPLQYARTLVEAAGEALAAAPAFSDRRNPSGLKDRIQRLLVPGYRPALRLTWSALLAAVFVGGGLLFFSALGTRVAIAAILSPQERIARIEQKMADLGEKPEFYGDHEKMPLITVSGHVRMADGSPVPKWMSVYAISVLTRFSSGTSGTARDGLFTNHVRAGTIYLGGEVPDYAPAFLGPLDGLTTNRLEDLELVFARGFDATIELTDANSGQPLVGARLDARFWARDVNSSYYHEHALTTDKNGTAVLTHAADLPLVVTANAPGHEILEQRFESVQPGKPLRIALRPGAKVTGIVLDKVSGQPIAGATVRIRFEKGPVQMPYSWEDTTRILATTDGNGKFAVDQLRTDTVYWLGVGAPGHESIVLDNIHAGNVLEARLGPELVVKGRVTGNLDLLEAAYDRSGGKEIGYTIDDSVGDNHSSFGHRAPVKIVDGVGYFQFTNQSAGQVEIQAPGHTETRDVTGPVDDWVIALAGAPNVGAAAPKREVVFRFTNWSGAPPRGAVSVIVPDNLESNHLTAHYQDMAITNGEVHVDIAIGGRTSLEAKQMVGYWFNSAGSFNSAGQNGSLLSIEVKAGPGPLVIDIPLVPAGVISAKARNSDGTVTTDAYFGVIELKRAPARDETSQLEGGVRDGSADNARHEWISSPLPLGGTYQIYAWRGNMFCVSKPVELTGANPDPEMELQFPPGKTFNGVVLDTDGKPLRETELRPLFKLPDNHGFGLKSVFTDERGRFRMENATPEAGVYSVELNAPGAMTESVDLDFGSQLQTIRLKRGRTLAGRVVNAGTGSAMANAEVRALDYERNKMPTVVTHTDADGHFEFGTLGEVNYTLYVAGGQLVSDKKFHADGNTNVLLRVKPY